MYELFSCFRSFGASDPRDKVYALLGLAQIEHVLDPLSAAHYDTTFTVFDVIWDLLDVELTCNKSLRFLRDCCGIEKPEGFPSWMPLWDHRGSPPPTIGQNPREPLDYCEEEPHVVFRAGGETRAVTRMIKDTKQLAIQGLICGIITGTGDMLDANALYRVNPAAHRLASRRKWAEMIGVDALEEFTQTLIELQIAGQIAGEQAAALFAHFLGEQIQEKEFLHSRCFETMMVSVSSQGFIYLVDRPVGTDQVEPEASLPNICRRWNHSLNKNVNERIAACDQTCGS